MPQDPFEALGLPRRFDLDQRRVRSAWRRRAAELHPDRATGDRGSGPEDPAPADEHEIARRAALLNEAKRALEDPERRADALLVLLGGPTREQEKSLPPEFLMEVMSVRESLEEAVSGGDDARVREHEQWALAQREDMIRRVGAALEALTDPPDADALRHIRTTLNAWRYIERMLEQTGSSDQGPGAGP